MQGQNTAVEVRVPGSGLPLYTDGKSLVALKPIADYFGLDWAGQFTKLKSKSWATIGKFSTVAADGKTREMTAGDRKTLTMWLATLDENRVRADKRAELIAYQSEAADALDKFFHEGVAISPRATEHQLNAAIFQARAQMELCQAAQGLIHPDHLEAKARVILARGMGENAQLDQQARPLYTADFLKGKNLSAKRTKSVSGVFGKRCKAAYVDLHGVEPQRYPLTLSNGQTRDVLAYTEADRELLESVWQQYYAEPTQLEVEA
ncbi:phage antirepressor N-terminal domain-containing protein [Gordonia otitidis]|uniref:phage antirepressor N-terminal domain-containing protein n=1 Tax=Gordonia otitidis TaxID=249058 RepID=UPI001D145505|nr:phage antirepressor N-terminal domain-containing protein [Gordonia otitidis]UEA61361.1 phage antirepressor N-terminal domain-containing protein [Gordonia otitidis]